MTKLEAWLEREKSGLNDFAILERHKEAIAVIEKLMAAMEQEINATSLAYPALEEALAIDPEKL